MDDRKCGGKVAGEGFNGQTGTRSVSITQPPGQAPKNTPPVISLNDEWMPTLLQTEPSLIKGIRHLDISLRYRHKS